METVAEWGRWSSNGDAAASQHKYPPPGESQVPGKVRMGLGGRIPPRWSRDVAEPQSESPLQPWVPSLPQRLCIGRQSRGLCRQLGSIPVFPLGWGRMLPAAGGWIIPALRCWGWGQRPSTPTARPSHSHALRQGRTQASAPSLPSENLQCFSWAYFSLFFLFLFFFLKSFVGVFICGFVVLGGFFKLQGV